ncbi:CHAT domain-containing protein [Streptomyces sp. NPDC004330]|uniref:CHAT domain-containing protein n=1 Tax=Streptomyces sp. NPDC004330 TaxID=3364700 RepID=UPI00368CFBFE
MTPARDHASEPAGRRMELARQWDRTLARVRDLPGFHDFLRPPEIGRLTGAATGGPVVALTMSRWRCDALVVHPEGVEVVEYRRLTRQAVSEQADIYLAALQRVERARREADLALRAYAADPSSSTVRGRRAAVRTLRESHQEQERTLRAVLAWLWDRITEPVLSALGSLPAPPDARPAGDPPPTRLWWCPTGPLTLLPLHAAGYHEASPSGGTDSVLDRVVSSYTPTVRALETARARTSAGHQREQRMLVVSMPDSPGQAPLRSAVEDRVLLAGLFAGSRHAVLEGPAATRDAVRRALQDSPNVHFSCHGTQDLTDPSAGGVLLADGVLSVAEISTDRHTGAFAFLSACKSATGGVALPDEVVTLAAALQHTGFRHVVATLWSVRDDAAAAFAADVYGHLCRGGVFRPEEAARAVHQATLNLRAAGVGLSFWTPFTHTGP